jgi:excinuclease ABC subunit C
VKPHTRDASPAVYDEPVSARREPRRAPRDVAARLPLAPGVYRFSDAAGDVLYLGRAVSLRRRVVSYWGDLRDRAHLSPMVARIASVEAVVCDSAHEAAWLERNLLQERLPPWNRSPSGGQEVEVWIRLSESARAPGVRVVHEPAQPARSTRSTRSTRPARPTQPLPQARHFGPYLGGRKVRLAVSGLCRVLPLAYAGADLAGARGDIARVLGVSAADRAALAETAAAVLDRDPDAVASLRGQLCARRDAAASALAFEFARRLHEEIDALDWISGEQKVTRPSSASFDACGWADGTLVRFTVRGGRLTGWSRRACDEASARPHLGETPGDWAAFARRNAKLAARLAD